jgi:hypothetical protein
MSFHKETRAGGRGLGDNCFSQDNSENAPKTEVAQANTIPSAEISQAKIKTLLDDVTDEAGWLFDQLNCLPNQRLAGDVDGVLHTLRRARCYWRVIAAEALLLVEAHGDLLSALRQEGQ